MVRLRHNRIAAVLAALAMAAGVLGLAAPPAGATQALGVQTVLDIQPGSANGFTSTGTMINVNGTLFFNGNNGTANNGAELWKSDGTAAGTVMVKDLRPTSSGNPTGMTNVNGTVFFAGSSDAEGIELWKSDGTEAGTVLVKDIAPGGALSSPTNLINVNGTLFFTATNGSAVNGIELWKSDGTTAGTVMVKDINTGTPSSSPANLFVWNGALYFSATTAASGAELWTSDGTTAGTVMVKEINAGTASSTPALFIPFSGKLFFRATEVSAGSELWSTDGTTAGTAMFKDMNPGTSGSNVASPVIFNGSLFFQANDSNTVFGGELWSSDGTPAGTGMVKDIFVGTFSSAPNNLFVFNGTLFFSAQNNNLDTELWKSDGTAAGTVLVKDINPGPGAGSSPGLITNLNGTLFFSALGELFTTDGTAAGTTMVADINPTGSSGPSQFVNLNGALFFRADGGSATGIELRKLVTNDSPVAVDDTYSTAEDTALTPAAPGVLANDTDANGDPLTAVVVVGPAHGSLTLNANGSFTYTPAANYHGPDSFTYRARDGIIGPTGPVQSDTPATVNITVTSVNDAGPVAVDDTISTAEDTPLAANVLTNDTDADNDTLTATKLSDPTNGGVVFNTDGSFTYTPNANFSGSDSFTYKANDGTVDSSPATVNITVTAVDDSPVAVDDSASTAEDTPVTVNAPGVLANDTDVDSGSLTAGSASDPANGGVTLNADGSFTYTPDANFNGADSFTYTASDGTSASNLATVNVTVSPVNDNPDAVDDAYSTTAGVPVTASAPGVLGNDTDIDGNSLTAGSASDPANGSVTLNADGSFTYTADSPGFSGADSFTYEASDGAGGTDTATVNITISPDPAATTLSVSNVNVAEGNAGSTAANFTVTRSGNASGASTVKYKTSGGTATAGTDYTGVPALTTVAFAAFETTKTVTIDVTGDDSAEADETFNLVLSAPTGATLADASGTATIVNDDGTAYISVGNVTVTEGNVGTTPAAFTLTRSGNTNDTSTVKYKTGGGSATAGSDYTGVALTTVTFGPGEATKTVNVDVISDSTDEANENLSLTLSAPTGATLADAGGVGYITDDDGVTTTQAASTFLAVDSITLDEGTGGTTAATLTVTRTGNTSTASSVKYKTTNGTATAGDDYTAAALTTLNFTAGQMTQTVTVDVTGDTAPESNETFNLVLSAPTGAVLADATGTVTVVNDDGAAFLSVNDISVTEGNTGTTAATFTVTRSGNTSAASTVKYKTTNGTAGAADFTAVGLTTVSFAAGQTTATVTIDITGDTLNEVNEKFTVVLSAATGATIADVSGTATIVDDD